MNKIIIVGSGNDFDAKKITDEAHYADYIIASDGGYTILKDCGIKPDIIIGDMDSITCEIDNDITINKYHVDKDLSDSELSLQYAISLNPVIIKLFAVTGCYFDHSFANVLNLFRNDTDSTMIEIVTANSTIFTVKSGGYSLSNLNGRRVSLFFLSPVTDFRLTGFKYNFSQTDLSPFDYSLSNIINNDDAVINFTDGKVICIVFDGGYE